MNAKTMLQLFSSKQKNNIKEAKEKELKDLSY